MYTLHGEKKRLELSSCRLLTRCYSLNWNAHTSSLNSHVANLFNILVLHHRLRTSELGPKARFIWQPYTDTCLWESRSRTGSVWLTEVSSGVPGWHFYRQMCEGTRQQSPLLQAQANLLCWDTSTGLLAGKLLLSLDQHVTDHVWRIVSTRGR